MVEKEKDKFAQGQVKVLEEMVKIVQKVLDKNDCLSSELTSAKEIIEKLKSELRDEKAETTKLCKELEAEKKISTNLNEENIKLKEEIKSLKRDIEDKNLEDQEKKNRVIKISEDLKNIYVVTK